MARQKNDSNDFIKLQCSDVMNKNNSYNKLIITRSLHFTLNNVYSLTFQTLLLCIIRNIRCLHIPFWIIQVIYIFFDKFLKEINRGSQMEKY